MKGLTMNEREQKQREYLLDESIPQELKQAMLDFIQVKENTPLQAGLYSDELRSWAHNFSGYKISEEKADDIIRTFSM